MSQSQMSPQNIVDFVLDNFLQGDGYPTEAELFLSLGKYPKGKTEQYRSVFKESVLFCRCLSVEGWGRKFPVGKEEIQEVFPDIADYVFPQLGRVNAPWVDAHPGEDMSKVLRERREEKEKMRKAEALRERVLTLLREVDSQSIYRNSKSHWAGGDTTVSLSFGSPNCQGSAVKVWSKNGKWTGNDCHRVYHLPENWKEEVCDVGIVLVDGMVTLTASCLGQVGPNTMAWKAIWGRQGAGFSIYPEEGYILRRGTDVIHAKTPEMGLRTLKKMVKGEKMLDL